jgi:hypothetical protein
MSRVIFSAFCNTYHGCQNFLGPNIPKWEKIYPTTTNYTKLPYIIPNDHELYQTAIHYVCQMAIKYSKLSQNITTFSIPRPSKIYPNWGKQTIWQPLYLPKFEREICSCSFDLNRSCREYYVTKQVRVDWNSEKIFLQREKTFC